MPAIGEALNIECLKTSLLGTTGGAVFAAIFVMLWQGVAMPIILFLSGLQTIPSEITEAAAIDGANSKQTFWNIELPYLLPSISMVFIMALKGRLNSFCTKYFVFVLVVDQVIQQHQSDFWFTIMPFQVTNTVMLTQLP